MSAHRSGETRETQVIVKEIKTIHSGRSRSGDSYTMYQVIATKPDGTAIQENLRSFEELPRDEVISVVVTPFVSEEYGTSYTLKAKEKGRALVELESLRGRVERLEAHLGMTPGVASGPPPPPESTAPAPPPIQPAPTTRDPW